MCLIELRNRHRMEDLCQMECVTDRMAFALNFMVLMVTHDGDKLL